MALHSLASVAITTQNLQVVRVIAAAFADWCDVIYLKRGAIFCRNAAHLATVIVALKDLKAQAGFDGLAFGLNPIWNLHIVFPAPFGNFFIVYTR